MFKYQNISILYNLIYLSSEKITNRTVSNKEENDLFLDLKPYDFLLKAVAPALLVPRVLNLRQKEGAVNKAVQQIGALPLNSVEFLWMMGVLVNLSIIHSHDYRAMYGIMNRVGLFSDSIHSIRFALTPLELHFFFFLPFHHPIRLFFLCLTILL